MMYRNWLFGALFALIELMAVSSAWAEVPLTFLPFSASLGEDVRCVQGPHGDYSHDGTLEYAYDFDLGPGENNSTNPAYGVAVYAPFTGEVVDVRTGVADFSNNSSSNSLNNNGLGNTVQLKVTGNTGTVYYMRFAHFQSGSVPSSVRVGAIIAQGSMIGRIGQTGYSTSPHLHVHLSTSAGGSSIQFEFAEGPVTTGTWITPRLRSNRFIVDNDGRATLGFPLSSVSTRLVSGSWSNYSWRTNTFGYNYRGSTSTGAKFRWSFTYAVPSSSNVRLNIYASCTNNTNRDRSAAYRTVSGTTTINKTVDQRTIGSSPVLIGTVTLSGGSRVITVEGTRSANTFCADGLIVDRI
jgi:hypothetical protein